MAFSLALGKEIPFDSSSVKKVLNSLGSSYKTLEIIFNLLSSWTNYVVLTELFSFVIFLYSPLIALKYESVKLILY